MKAGCTRDEQRGFSYIWVLLMVVALSLGVVKAAEIESRATQREQERMLLAIGHEFRKAIGSYYELALPNGAHQYPETLEQLLKDDRSTEVRRHLRKIYVDPMTGSSEWGLVRTGGRIVGIHSLSKKSAIKQTGFENDDLGFVGKQKIDAWVFSYPADLTWLPSAKAP